MYRGLVAKMIGASILDLRLYRQVKEDKADTVEAVKVVIIVALAAGIPSVLLGDSLLNLLIFVLSGWPLGLISWAVGVWTIYYVGTAFLGTPETDASLSQLARTIGFAEAPAVLSILQFNSILINVAIIVVSVWVFITMVVAVQVTLNYKSTWRAVGAVVAGVVLGFFVTGFLQLIIRGPSAPGGS